MRALIIDDQRSARRVLSSLLTRIGGIEIETAASLKEARVVIAQSPPDIALVDMRLSAEAGNRDGLTLVHELLEHTTALPVMVTAHGDMSDVRRAMRAGAYDYILKEELCAELILPVIERARSRRLLEQEVAELRARQHGEQLAEIIGTSAIMQRLRGRIRKVATSDRPVLVRGPTGSGKELVVRAIHRLGPNPEQPLLDLNCAAIPAQLLESQLFGHERGAFTGADSRHLGYFEAVGRGTLFLDEIGEMPLLLQAKLLRVLETRSFRRVGSTSRCTFQGRVVAATHVDLPKEVADGAFREDLFFRLQVLPLDVPALDKRREDIPALLAHVSQTASRKLRFDEQAMVALRQRSWPGNVRELRNAVDRLAVFCDNDLVTADDIALHLDSPQAAAADDLSTLIRRLLDQQLDAPLAEVERALIDEALRRSSGNKSEAARLLGVHRKVIERRLSRSGTRPR